MSFENDPRRRQELKGRRIADNIYRKNWGDIEIQRYDKDNKLVLDREFAIDVTITMPNGMVLNGQEKFLSYKYLCYSTLTIEYMQDPSTGEEGDWFKLASQFYMCAYFDEAENDFCKYVIVDWAKLVLSTNQNDVTWQINNNKDGRAKASFKHLGFNDIPIDCIWDKRI